MSLLNLLLLPDTKGLGGLSALLNSGSSWLMNTLFVFICQVLITVLDINDCRPQFAKKQFSTSVYENEPSGTSVITMTATDLDEGDNGIVTYNIEGPGVGM